MYGSEALEHIDTLYLCHFLYDSNPLAKRIIDIINSYVTGDGFTFSAKNEAVFKVLDSFWRDPVNNWPLKQLDRFRQLSLYGEQLWPVFVRKTDGRVRLGYVDPANINRVDPNFDNPEILEWAHVNTLMTIDGTTPQRAYSLIHVDEDPTSPNEGKLTYTGSNGAFYFAVNKVSNATRGRSDLLTIFDWLDLYDQYRCMNLTNAI